MTGCNLNYHRPVEPAMNPQSSDEAQARRQWKQQDAVYANSGIKAFANRARYNYETASTQYPATGILLGPLAFVAQSLVLPFTFIRAAPFARETYRTLEVEPSFTVNPARDPQGPAVANGGGGAGETPTNAAGTPIQPSAPGVTPGGNPGGLPANPTPGSPRPSGAGSPGAGGSGGGGAGGAGGK